MRIGNVFVHVFFLLSFPQNILHRVTVKGNLSLRAQCLQLRQTGIYPARMRRRPWNTAAGQKVTNHMHSRPVCAFLQSGLNRRHPSTDNQLPRLFIMRPIDSNIRWHKISCPCNIVFFHGSRMLFSNENLWYFFLFVPKNKDFGARSISLTEAALTCTTIYVSAEFRKTIPLQILLFFT